MKVGNLAVGSTTRKEVPKSWLPTARKVKTGVKIGINDTGRKRLDGAGRISFPMSASKGPGVLEKGKDFRDAVGESRVVGTAHLKEECVGELEGVRGGAVGYCYV